MLYQRQSAISHKPVLLDVYLLVSIGICLMIGMVMVLSASMAVAHHVGLNPFYYFAKQFIYAALGIILGLGALYTPTKFWEELGPFWLLGGIVLLLLVLVPGIGHMVNGSRRWIRLGPVALQVSELVKLCGIMYVSNYLVRQGAFAREHFIGVMKPIALLGLMAILLLMEPDFGATVVLFVSVLGVMFMAGVRLRWFSLLIGLGVVAVVLLVILSPYRLARLTGFLHPWQNQYDTGYQLTQALIAFGRGGWFGVGLGESLQKLFYLPEAHTDFIAAILAEELGLIGIFFVLGLFVTMVWRGLMIAKKAHLLDRLFSAYVAYGITFWMAMQVLVNIGVNI